MRTRTTWIIVILILAYVGPYAFVYGRTAKWTFPRIENKEYTLYFFPSLLKNSGHRNYARKPSY